jgi:hypothetical protein
MDSPSFFIVRIRRSQAGFFVWMLYSKVMSLKAPHSGGPHTMTETIEALKKEIIRCLRPMNPEKVILFGSHAAGTAPLR